MKYLIGSANTSHGPHPQPSASCVATDATGHSWECSQGSVQLDF